MDVWINGWIDLWINGWMDECMDQWMDECMDGWIQAVPSISKSVTHLPSKVGPCAL
jgi:hypothetical protein